MTAATGIETVNSLGNISSFVGPYRVGLMTDLSGSVKWGLVTIVAVMVLGALVIMGLGDAPASGGLLCSLQREAEGPARASATMSCAQPQPRVIPEPPCP